VSRAAAAAAAEHFRYHARTAVFAGRSARADLRCPDRSRTLVYTQQLARSLARRFLYLYISTDKVA